MNDYFIEPDKFKSVSFKEIDTNSKKYKYYYKDKEKLQEQYTLENVIEIINSSHITSEYIKHMTEFNTSILYKSEGHGINHNIRVCFLAYIIAIKENISKEDFSLIIESCKYHDIGRINDYEDKLHGKRSSEMLDFLEEQYTVDELNYIKTIITCHSLDDKEFEKVAIKNRIKDFERCKKMHEILKDSDGLDRVRLSYPCVNRKYIRTRTAKKMILFSHELFHNYSEIIK